MIEYVSRFRSVCLLLLVIFWSSSQTTYAEQGKFSLGSGIDYSSGTFGGTASTDVKYIPITGKYETRDWLYKLTVPYIQITGPGNVTPNIGQTVYASNAVRTDAGLGDVIAAATYSVINSARSGIAVDLTGKVKFGTADKSKGMGTGANDYTAEISVYKMLGRYDTFGTAGYKTFGQSLGYTLNNVYFGSIGFGYKATDKINLGIIYDYRQPTSPLNDPQKIWTVFANWKLISHWKTQTYLFSGSGNSSPQIGGGAILTRLF